MKHISKIGRYVLPLFLSLASATTQAEDTWRCIFTQDFGGNDPNGPRFSTTALSGDQGESSIKFKSGGVSTGTGFYSIGKYPQNEKGSSPDWYVCGDHTNEDDKESGYFLMLDCPQGCYGSRSDVLIPCTGATGEIDYETNYVYQCTLSESLCSNVTFKFEAWLAELNSEPNTYVVLGIYDGSNTPLWELNKGNGDRVPPSSKSSSKYNWQLISGEFDVPATADLSSIKFRINPVKAVSKGFDIGLDDIAIYIKQPKVNVSATEFEYNQPGKLTAEITDNKFFADMNDVQFYWEYSADGKTGWKEVGGTRSYKNFKNFEYEIDSFDKNDATGQGNGYYRLTIANSSNIGSIKDQSVCCLREVYQIKETKNKMHLLLCENETATIGGYPFSKADDGSTKTAQDFEVTTEVIFNRDSLESKQICVGEQYGGTVYDEVNANGIYLGVAEVISSVRKSYNLKTCDSVSVKKTLYVTNKIEIINDVDSTCEGKTYKGKLWDTAGEFVDKDDQGCNVLLNIMRVGPTYNIVETRTECEGFVYNGKKYDVGEHDLPETKFKTYGFGCDSIEKIHVIVNKKSTRQLDDAIICQSDFGANKVSYSFGGKDYKNTTNKVMEFDAENVLEGKSYLGCDSIETQHVIIYPMIHQKRDTTICRDQILFGKEWTVAGQYDYEQRFTTANGCDSVITYNINVLSIQLKLRADTKDNNVCLGQAATIHVEIIPDYTPVIWEPQFSSPDPLNPKVSPVEDTKYVAHAFNDDVGCHATDSILITVSPMPTLIIDSVNTMERYVEFSVSGGTGDYSYWIGNANNDNSYNDFSSDRYFHQVQTDGSTLENIAFGTHLFRVVDEKGCAVEDTIKLEPQPIEPSAVITPNGDGINDTWVIKNIEAYGSDAFVRIYTRFGKLVYESDRNVGYDSANGFDGTCNGVKLPSTDYWYVIDIESLDKQYVGHFSLLR